MNRNSSRLGVEVPENSPKEAMTEPADAGSVGLSFVTPTEIVELPTQGKFYPKGHPLHGVEDIEIRHMTTKDQDVLNNKTLIKKGKALERTIQGLITNPAIQLDDMFVGDKNAVILQARISGISEEYNVNITCPSCGTPDEYKYDLREIKAYLGDTEAEISNEGTFEFELPVSKHTVEVKLLTGRDEKYLQQQEMKKRKHKLPETPLTDQFKKLIVSVNDETGEEVIGKFVECMLNKDAMALSKRYNEVAPNIDMKQPFDCNACDFSDIITVPLTPEFFWPKR